MVVTRFAPSPTGYLHIGGARTALYNWLYARHFGGKFYLRIEDTDRERSTQDAIDKIFESLEWLNLKWDNDPVFQFSRAPLHAKLALNLVKEGKAYFCYCTPEELEEMRQKALSEGKSPKYNGMWRNRDPKDAPAGIRPVVRLKANNVGKSVLHDMVQGTVIVDNSELDDLVLLRSDGTPTYMLSVVYDDHDMGITHVIRGDDHLTNTFRQMQIYDACGWDAPTFGHIPLIHGPDGAKLSKRHGALGVENYKDMGFLPESMCNYLLRLGWSHGNDEVISREQAIEWFNAEKLGKSPSRLDLAKLTNLNAHYIRESRSDDLCKVVIPVIEKMIGRNLLDIEVSRITVGMDSLKQRAKVIQDIAELAKIYLTDFVLFKHDETNREILTSVADEIQKIDWNTEALEMGLHNLADRLGKKFGEIAGIIRWALSNRKISPGIFDMMKSLGLEESLRRIRG